MIHKCVILRALHLSLDATSLSSSRNDQAVGTTVLASCLCLVCMFCVLLLSDCAFRWWNSLELIDGSGKLASPLEILPHRASSLFFLIFSRGLFSDRIFNPGSLLVERQCCFNLCVSGIWCHVFNSTWRRRKRRVKKSILQLPVWLLATASYSKSLVGSDALFLVSWKRFSFCLMGLIALWLLCT